MEMDEVDGEKEGVNCFVNGCSKFALKEHL